jgi:hypothetical protein
MLAGGRSMEEILDLLRHRGLTKLDCVLVVHGATGASMGQAKRVVHNSPTWADRREQDEQTEDAFLRALFIDCVLGGGHIDQPAELAAECCERQLQAATWLQAAAAGLPSAALADYRQAMVANRLGQAFVALVAAGQQRAVPGGYWQRLAEAARTSRSGARNSTRSRTTRTPSWIGRFSRPTRLAGISSSSALTTTAWWRTVSSTALGHRVLS